MHDKQCAIRYCRMGRQRVCGSAEGERQSGAPDKLYISLQYLRNLLFFVASNTVITKYISSVLNVCIYRGVGLLKISCLLLLQFFNLHMVL